MKIERRYFELSGLEVRKADGKRSLVGHAAVFDKWSVNLGGFREIIRRGAFKDSLGQDDIRALWNHNTDIVLGRNKAGTLRLQEDEQGLRIELDLPETQAGRDAEVSVGRGDVSQMSFAFRTNVGGDRWFQENGEDRRELLSLGLREVSPVAFPAYPDTDIALAGLRAAGLDVAALDQVLARRSAGQELRADDTALIEAAIGVLEQYRGAPRSPSISREEQYDMLRRHLALMEAQ